MSTLPGSLIFCFIFASATSDQGLQFSNVSTPDSDYCGKCDALEEEFVELKEESVTLNAEVSRLEEMLNLDKCFKGMEYGRPFKRILLWDKVPAWCDTSADGGGWIVIQSRRSGDVDFYRDWKDYKNGFGTTSDFWIGNDVIHKLTSQGYTELRVDMVDLAQYFAHYSHFEVADEASLYRLSVSGYSGTAGDALSYHNGSNFSTFDRDNDNNDILNSAAVYHAGWWYNSGYTSNLNGVYGGLGDTKISWGNISMFWYACKVMVRHV